LPLADEGYDVITSLQTGGDIERQTVLNRQKTLLYFLEAAGGQATALCLVKWAFLLREESVTRGGSSFYEFLPYKFGPYSFCIEQEMTALAQQGYVETAETQNHTAWLLTGRGKAMARSVPVDVAGDARRIHWRYGRMNGDSLLDNIYPRYTWFTVNSQRQKLAARPCARPATYTAGYEGVSVDGFLNGLMRAGIQRIIDVRHNPVSRRYGFHKSTLSRLAGYLDIDYVHVPALGIRSENRQSLESQADYDALFTLYRLGTLKEEADAIGRVAQWMAEKPSVLVCMEAEPARCHRSHLATVVAAESGLPVNHLRVS